MHTLNITPAELHAWVDALWRAAGSSATEARRTADHLVQANLTGHDSHGVGMIPNYVDSLIANRLQLNQTLSIVADHGSLLTVDGQGGMGQSVAFQAMELAVERAHAAGVCVMGLRRAHHLGRVGHWAEMAMRAGLVSIHFTNAVSRPWVAPFGGAQGRFVTNPFTVGVPRRDGPDFLLDFATSAIAHGKARVAHLKSVPVPMGAVLDAAGHPSDDPGVLFRDPVGALTTFAGHKGYALAMMCEILGAALTGGPLSLPETEMVGGGVWNSMLTVVFDPAKLGDPDEFERAVARFQSWVQSAPLAPGFDRIRMPGDPEREAAAARSQGIPIDAGTLAQLDEAASKINALRGAALAKASVLARDSTNPHDGSAGAKTNR